MAGWELGNTSCIDKVMNDSYVTTSQVTSLVCFTYILPLIHNLCLFYTPIAYIATLRDLEPTKLQLMARKMQ